MRHVFRTLLTPKNAFGYQGVQQFSSYIIGVVFAKLRNSPHKYGGCLNK